MGKSFVSKPFRAVAGVVVFGLAITPALAGNNPVDEDWWPSEFGAEDQQGAVNYITPEKRLEAVKLVRQGKTLTLGMPYQRGMPLSSDRTYTLTILGGGRPMQGPARWQGDLFRQTFNDEFLSTEIGQVGTQFDGLGHPMIWVSGRTGWAEGNYMYNGRRLEDYANGHGLQVNGVEQVARVGFFTRGILIDVAAMKGVERLRKGEEVTLKDYRAALQRQQIEDAGQGDVVLIRTGWIQLWKGYLGQDGRIAAPAEVVEAANREFGSGEPGVSAELCDYLAGRKIALLALDQGAVEPLDSAKNPSPEPFGPCHMNLVTRRGIYLFENLDLEGLSEERAFEFLFTWAPLKLVGATGSPGNPIAAW